MRMRMETSSRKSHWDHIYSTKPTELVSWYQPRPVQALQWIAELGLEPSAPLIDIGGGDSLLADYLLEMGHTDITVLDISEAALDRARARLGTLAGKLHWIASDCLDFEPVRAYSLWYDRAVFHFLTEPMQVRRYLEVMRSALEPGGYLILATFSEKGPDKCSGLPVQRYSVGSLTRVVGIDFEPLHCLNALHKTPSGDLQDFTHCLFRRRG